MKRKISFLRKEWIRFNWTFDFSFLEGDFLIFWKNNELVDLSKTFSYCLLSFPTSILNKMLSLLWKKIFEEDCWVNFSEKKIYSLETALDWWIILLQPMAANNPLTFCKLLPILMQLWLTSIPQNLWAKIKPNTKNTKKIPIWFWFF